MIPEICPNWFQGFNLAFQLLFLAITAGISYTAFRAYQFFAREQHKYLSLGFAVFALSYVAATVSSFAHLLGGVREIAVGALYLHWYLFLAAVMVLLFAYLKIEQASVRAVMLILVFGFVAVVTRPSGMMQDVIFHLVTAVLLFFIVAQLTQGYKRTCKKTTLCVTLGFVALTIGQLIMAFAGINQIFFVVAGVFTLLGFLSIASSRIIMR